MMEETPLLQPEEDRKVVWHLEECSFPVEERSCRPKLEESVDDTAAVAVAAVAALEHSLRLCSPACALLVVALLVALLWLDDRQK